ncbi:hypothetical protein V7161_27975 [Neobacillus drentensis]
MTRMKTLTIILINLNCLIFVLTMLSIGCMIIVNKNLSINDAFVHLHNRDGARLFF